MKFHLIKRHLYLIPGINEIPDELNWYELGVFHAFFYKCIINKYNIETWINNFYYKSYFKYKTKNYPDNFNNIIYKEQIKFRFQAPVEPSVFLLKYPRIFKYTWIFVTKWHYILMVSVLIFDLKYNNCQIHHIFNILPWIFFYECYLRCSFFIDNLHLPYDKYIHTILYNIKLVLVDKKMILIDDSFYDLEHLKKIYNTYILRNFIKDSNDL